MTLASFSFGRNNTAERIPDTGVYYRQCLLYICRFNWKQSACCMTRALAGLGTENGTGLDREKRCRACLALVESLVTPWNAKCNYRSIAPEGSISNWTPIQGNLGRPPAPKRRDVVLVRQIEFHQISPSSTIKRIVSSWL